MTKKDLDVTEGVDSISRAIKSFNDSFDSEHSAEEPARRRRSRPLNERRQNVPSPKEPRQRPKRQPTKPAEAEQWGPPTATLNTRIPAEIAELLDGLHYQLRKRHGQRRITKQELTVGALTDLLAKHGLLKWTNAK